MAETHSERLLERVPSLKSIGFDYLFAVLTLWFVIGIFLDGRSHTHGAPETFFTPEHAVFYSAFLAIAVLLGISIFRNRMQGALWRNVLPDGYGSSLLGVVIFGLGGVGDMLWHELFGIEANVEALLSPTHLLLMVGSALFVSGPLRAAWRHLDQGDSRWAAQFPLVISTTITLSIFTFATMYAHPIVNPLAGAGHRYGGQMPAIVSHELGVVSIMLQTAILTGFLLLLVQRFTLTQGAITAILTFNAGAMSLLTEHYKFIPAWLVAGVLADLLISRLDLSRSRDLRAFAFIVPTVLFSLYFATLGLIEGIAWTVHVWTGAIVLPGLVGWLESYLVVPIMDTDKGVAS